VTNLRLSTRPRPRASSELRPAAARRVLRVGPHSELTLLALSLLFVDHPVARLHLRALALFNSGAGALCVLAAAADVLNVPALTCLLLLFHPVGSHRSRQRKVGVGLASEQAEKVLLRARGMREINDHAASEAGAHCARGDQLQLLGVLRVELENSTCAAAKSFVETLKK